MAYAAITKRNAGDAILYEDQNQMVDNFAAMGLIHVKSQAFTSATSLTLDNIFTTTYRAYRIHLSITSASGISWWNAVFRSSAPADVTASNYDFAGIQTTTNTDRTRVTGTSQANVTYIFLHGDRGGFATIDIMNPAQTDYTHAVSHGFGSDTSVSSSNQVTMGFGYRATTAHAGIKFGFGTASGVARVYAFGEG